MIGNIFVSVISKTASLLMAGIMLLTGSVNTQILEKHTSATANKPAFANIIEGFHDIRPGDGVSEVKLLSDYFAQLKGTNGDTQVYVLNGEQEGPTALLLGGTHGNEISGIFAATVWIETAKVKAGRVIVIPVANYSASLTTDSWRPDVKTVSIETPSGTRTFRYGNRRTNPNDQVYTEEPFIPYEGYKLEPEESGNLNRVYPGKSDGNLTQQVAYAIMQLIEKEKVDIAVDMHEAGPVGSIAYYLISNPNVMNISKAAFINILDYDFIMNLDKSGIESIGLSHREWGDRTNVAAFLIETANPGQDYYDVDKKADVMKDPDNPIEKRVAIQIYTTLSIFKGFEEKRGKALIVEGIPGYFDMLEKGIGVFMK